MSVVRVQNGPFTGYIFVSHSNNARHNSICSHTQSYHMWRSNKTIAKKPPRIEARNCVRVCAIHVNLMYYWCDICFPFSLFALSPCLSFALHRKIFCVDAFLSIQTAVVCSVLSFFWCWCWCYYFIAIAIIINVPVTIFSTLFLCTNSVPLR